MSNKIKIKLAVILPVLAVSIFTSCYRDATVPQVAPEVTKDISFSGDVLPIFSSNCISCHKSGGQAPDLTSANAYSVLTAGTLLNLSAPSSSVLYLRMAGLGGSAVMPPSGANAGNAATVLAWIKQGAKNN